MHPSSNFETQHEQINMKHLLLILTLCASVVAQGQFWVTSVATSPPIATDCVPFDLAITGNMPASNYSLSIGTAVVTGSIINVTLIFTSSGFGIPTITPFSTSIPVTGATPAGAYTVIADYTAAGNTELSSWSIIVDPCFLSCGPDPTGLVSVPNPSGSVMLEWNPVPGSIACRVRGRVASTIPWATASPVFGIEPTLFVIPGAVLTSGANYEWQVKCACVISPLDATGWSATSTFVAPSARLAGALDITLSPNPAHNFIQLNGVDAGTAYELFNSMGSKVAQGQFNGPIAIESLPAGMYNIRVQNEVKSFLIAR